MRYRTIAVSSLNTLWTSVPRLVSVQNVVKEKTIEEDVIWRNVFGILLLLHFGHLLLKHSREFVDGTRVVRRHDKNAFTQKTMHLAPLERQITYKQRSAE